MSHDERLRESAGTTMHNTVNRIVATFNRATPSDIEAGARWYADGEDFVQKLAQKTGQRSETVAAVVAHLSPRTTWSRNLLGATLLLEGRNPEFCMSANVARAEKARRSDHPLGTLNGPKTRRFALNLLGDREAVTVDVWALRVALGERDDAELVIGRVGVYEAVEQAYRLAARRLGVDPVTCQATCWIVARGGRAD